MKFAYQSESDIPAGLREHYAERDGKFVLQVEGAAEKARLDEFRESNIALRKELDGLKAKSKEFEGVDLAEARKLIAQAEQQKERKLIEAGEVDKLIEKRTGAVRDKLAGEIAELRKAKEALVTQLSEREINTAVLKAAAEHGVQKTATEDVLARAQRVFRLVDGRAEAVDAKGEPLLDSDGRPLSVAGWVEGLAKDAPHLFEHNTGGGASGTGAGGGGSKANGANPFDRDSGWNLTEQMKLMKENPALAQRMKLAAG